MSPLSNEREASLAQMVHAGKPVPSTHRRCQVYAYDCVLFPPLSLCLSLSLCLCVCLCLSLSLSVFLYVSVSLSLSLSVSLSLSLSSVFRRSTLRKMSKPGRYSRRCRTFLRRRCKSCTNNNGRYLVWPMLAYNAVLQPLFHSRFMSGCPPGGEYPFCGREGSLCAVKF